MSDAAGWRMPIEGERHERTWMAWPHSGYTLGDTAAEADAARATWAAVAHAVAGFEPVVMVVDPSATQVARDLLGSEIELLEAPLDDAWMRDIGPSFVLADDGRLGAVDWVFNGWGAAGWASWEHDAKIGRFVAEAAGAELIESPIVNEGGGFHVDGQGTVLLTETVQLGEGRNPDATKAEIEAELARTLGTSHAIWLPRGLARDYDEFGTRGHIDIVATFASPGTVLLHHQESPEHPDHELSAQLESLLLEQVTAEGKQLEVQRLVAPQTLTDEHGPVDYSYVNHLVTNGGVVACTFDDPNDAAALDTLAQAYPGREIVGVDARELFARGGGIHCITQQQPVSSPY